MLCGFGGLAHPGDSPSSSLAASNESMMVVECLSANVRLSMIVSGAVRLSHADLFCDSVGLAPTGWPGWQTAAALLSIMGSTNDA